MRTRLDRSSGGVIFTTVQKFMPMAGEEQMPVLTDRRNVIVLADEAHRSQYGFDARLNRQTGERRYGFAHYIREALPNASFIGFTGHRSKPTTSTRRRSSATTSTSTTSAAPSKTTPPSRSTTKAASPASSSTRTKSQRSTPRSKPSSKMTKRHFKRSRRQNGAQSKRLVGAEKRLG